EYSDNVQEFMNFYSSIYRTDELVVGQMTRILTAAAFHQAGRALVCKDCNKRTIASIFLVWDENYCYYLLSARARSLAGNGAISLLLWEAIKLSAERRLRFDFDSFNSIGAGRFIYQFGARPVPRWRIRKMNPLVRAFEAVVYRR